MNNKALQKQNKKWLSVLLTICMVITLIPATVMADTGKARLAYDQDVIEPEYIAGVDTADGASANGQPTRGTTYYTSEEEAAAYLREQLVNRVTDTILIPYDLGEGFTGTLDDAASVRRSIFDAAIEHTGKGNEGDYIKKHMGSYTMRTSYSPSQLRLVTFKYDISFLSTADQEAAVTEKLSQVMPSLVNDGMSDYDKFIAIYDYICQHVSYDHAGLAAGDSDLIYTAYAALIQGTSVCQGYASLLYRMLLMANVPARLVSGYTDPADQEHTRHAWNIVKIGDYYYNVDVTWDSDEHIYAPNDINTEIRYTMNWRLRCDANFPDHYAEVDMSQYTKSTNDYPNPSITGHSISLADQIGVKFFVYVPAEADMTDAYMDFVISSGRKITVPWSESSGVYQGYPMRVVTCPITPLEYSDTITATLHFGEGGNSTMVNRYSAQQYCEYIQEHSSDFHSSVLAVVQSIHDYAYYLSKSEWSDGKTNHNAIPETGVTAYDATMMQQVKNDVDTNYPFVKLAASGYEKVGFSLTLNNMTTINLYFKLSFTPSSLPDGFSEITMNGETWYLYQIKGVHPVNYNNYLYVWTAQFYPISYVGLILNGNYSDAKKEAVMAYYYYCTAASTYYALIK